MEDKRKALLRMREQKANKISLENGIAEIMEQYRVLNAKSEDLREVMLREQKDVDRLKKGGIVSLFYGVRGKMDDKLEKEQREAREAAVRYEEIQRELELLNRQKQLNEAALSALKDCEAEYEALIEALLAGMSSDHIVQMEPLNNQLLKAKEKVSDVRTALQQVDTIRNHLNEASRWACMVQFGNGEVAAKSMEDELWKARSEMEQLQSRAERLEANIKVHPSLISGFGNRMLSGGAVMQMVKNTLAHLYHVKNSLRECLEQAETKEKSAERERDERLMELL